MTQLKQTGVVKHAPYLDFVSFLPAAYNAVRNNTDWDGMEKILFWVMLVVQINIFGRACELCQYCPKVEHIKYPVEACEWSEDGYPH